MRPSVETHRADGCCRTVRSDIGITEHMCAWCTLCIGRIRYRSCAKDWDIFPSFIDSVRWNLEMSVFRRNMKSATMAHDGMTCKDTDLPYILHHGGHRHLTFRH